MLEESQLLTESERFSVVSALTVIGTDPVSFMLYSFVKVAYFEA